MDKNKEIDAGQRLNKPNFDDRLKKVEDTIHKAKVYAGAAALLNCGFMGGVTLIQVPAQIRNALNDDAVMKARQAAHVYTTGASSAEVDARRSAELATERAEAVKDLPDRLQLIETQVGRNGRAFLTSTAEFPHQSPTAFIADRVLMNTLSQDAPKTSEIEVPYDGGYLVTISMRVCRPGSTGYISVLVEHNSNYVASAVNSANECGSAVAVVTVQTTQGDVISGKCSVEQRIPGMCSMTLVFLSAVE